MGGRENGPRRLDGANATEREDAVAAILGALAHGLMRVFQISAQAVVWAPNLAMRERQAAFAVEEFERYRVVRKRLGVLTPNVEASIDRFREGLDGFYDAAPVHGWLEAQVFHYVGDTITADFAEIFSASVDSRTAAAVREALTGRAAHEAFALEQILAAREDGEEQAEERIVGVAGKIVGEAINRVREAVLASNSLEVVLGGGDAVKDCVLQLLGRHRERLDRLGLDQLD